MIVVLKDDALAKLAEHHNVAQFISVDTVAMSIRHVVVRDFPAGIVDLDVAIDILLDRSRDHKVNVRSFDPLGRRKSTPFHMGVDSCETVLDKIRSAAQDGLYCIVNGSLDVHDGGVSGVAMPEVVEFAPDATPRIVESGDVFSAPPRLAIPIGRIVYGVDLGGVVQSGRRIEFSVHPHRCGDKGDKITVWETGSARPIGEVRAPLVWPNAFSRHIGDKAFGLMVADVLGLNVPLTTVIARRVPPFVFGKPTGVGDVWLRTAPHVPRPGLYPTTATWTDPFEMLSSVDPGGTELASVLVQEAVDARWSGATRPSPTTSEVQGVAGRGDEFMLGSRPPETLPRGVVQDVQNLVGAIEPELGAVRIEWVHDGERVWVVQLHLAVENSPSAFAGSASQWMDFDPTAGLDALRELVEVARREHAGVRVVRPVGVTSHVGEIIRAAGLPAEYART